MQQVDQKKPLDTKDDNQKFIHQYTPIKLECFIGVFKFFQKNSTNNLTVL
jgi:hypothetical protein